MTPRAMWLFILGHRQGHQTLGSVRGSAKRCPVVNHICKFKFSNSHIKKSKKEKGGHFNVFYVNQYI